MNHNIFTEGLENEQRATKKQRFWRWIKNSSSVSIISTVIFIGSVLVRLGYAAIYIGAIFFIGILDNELHRFFGDRKRRGEL